MPLTTTAKCDLCGAERLMSNHWFLARVGRGARKRLTLTILSYTDAEAAQGGDILCGESCTHKWLGQKIQQLVRVNF